jgi:hypothetical protein
MMDAIERDDGLHRLITLCAQHEKDLIGTKIKLQARLGFLRDDALAFDFPFSLERPMIGRQGFRQAAGSCYIMRFRLRAGVVIAALIAETGFGGLPRLVTGVSTSVPPTTRSSG